MFGSCNGYKLGGRTRLCQTLETFRRQVLTNDTGNHLWTFQPFQHKSRVRWISAFANSKNLNEWTAVTSLVAVTKAQIGEHSAICSRYSVRESLRWWYLRMHSYVPWNTNSYLAWSSFPCNATNIVIRLVFFNVTAEVKHLWERVVYLLRPLFPTGV